MQVEMDRYRSLKRRVLALKQGRTASMVPIFMKHVKSFERAINIEESNFQADLKKLLPKIRAATVKEEELAHLRRKYEDMDHYGIGQLINYMDLKQKEDKALDALIAPGINTSSERDLIELRNNDKIDYVRAFFFYLYPKKDNFTECIKEDCGQKNDPICSELHCDQNRKYVSWIGDTAFSLSLRQSFVKFGRIIHKTDYSEKIVTGTILLDNKIANVKNKQYRHTIHIYKRTVKSGSQLLTDDLTLPTLEKIDVTQDKASKETKISWIIKVYPNKGIDEAEPKNFKPWIEIKYRRNYTQKYHHKRAKLEEKTTTIPSLLGDFEMIFSLYCKYGLCAKQWSQFLVNKNPYSDDCNTESNLTRAGTPKEITIAAIGRAFTLGALYDARRDNVIPGLTLWDQEILDSHATQNISHTYAHSTSDISFQGSVKQLEMQAELTASFVSGMVKVHGAAKYLDSKSLSTKFAQLTYVYRYKDHHNKLTMEHLRYNMTQYPDLLARNDTEATHVVTQIDYGVEAIFRFSREIHENESRKEINAELTASIKKFGIDAGGKVNLTNEEKQNYSKISCEFNGDIKLDHPPTTTLEAIEMFQTLPSKSTPETMVPLRVRLMPLVNLNPPKLPPTKQIEIKPKILSEIQECIETYTVLSTGVADVKHTAAYKRLNMFQAQINNFGQALLIHRNAFRMQLHRLLPMVRAGKAKQDVLEDILHKLRHSLEDLQDYVKEKLNEAAVLNNKVSDENIVIVSEPGDFEHLIFNGSVKYVLSFTLTLYPLKEPFTECITYNCGHHVSVGEECKKLECDKHKKYVSWRNESQTFGNFAKYVHIVDHNAILEAADRTRSDVRLMLREKARTDEKLGMKVQVFVDGKMTEKDFRLPSITDIRIKKRNCTGTTITWKIDAKISLFSILYQRKKEGNWFIVDTNKREFFMPISTEFEVHVGAFCTFGICASQYFQSNKLKKLDCSLKARVILIGGESKEEQPINSMELFVPFNHSATQLKMKLPSQRSGHMAVILRDGTVLIAGGSAMSVRESVDPFTKRTDLLNLATGQMKQTADMHSNRGLAGATNLYNFVYICGGQEYPGGPGTKSCEKFKCGKWIKVQEMKEERFGVALVTYNRKIYAIGGSKEVSKSVEVYDSKTKTWSISNALKHNRQGASATVLHRAIYVCGGLDISSTAHLKSCEKFKAGKGWSNIASMNRGRVYFSLIGVDSQRKLYAMGGWKAGRDIYSIESTSPHNTTEWVTESARLHNRRGKMPGVLVPANFLIAE